MGKRTISVYGCVLFMVLMIGQCSAKKCAQIYGCSPGMGFECRNIFETSSHSTCTPCHPGSFSPGAKSICLPCARGHFQDGTKQSTCKKCRKGSYQAETGKASCVACPNGQTTQYEGEPENGACVTTESLLIRREGVTYDCERHQPCNPQVTRGLRAYAHSDKNKIVNCTPRRGGGNDCVIRRCPGGTEFFPSPELLRCFSVSDFDCGSRNPCYLAGSTGQYKYRHPRNNRYYVECEEKDWTLICVVKVCITAAFDLTSQSCRWR